MAIRHEGETVPGLTEDDFCPLVETPLPVLSTTPRRSHGYQEARCPHHRHERRCHALARYGALERDIARIESDLAEEVARLREAADVALAPLHTELTTTLLGLEAFAKRSRPTLPTGQKTIRLSTGDLGWRIGNPTVSLKVKVGTMLERIKALGEGYTKKYVRTKETLDRPALLRDRPAIDGIRYALGRERFYVTARSDTGEAKAVIEAN